MIDVFGFIVAAKLALGLPSPDPRFAPAADSARRAADTLKADPAAAEAAQAEVLRELKKLLDEPPKGQPPAPDKPKNEPKGTPEPTPQPKTEHRPEPSPELLPQPREATPAPAADRPPDDAMSKEAWGMLPERQRRGLMRFARDRWMAGSEELLRDYYSGLAAPRPPKGKP